MDADLRKQLGLKKSIQALQQAASPTYRLASPLLKEAGTPAPFLRTVKKDLFSQESTDEFEILRHDSPRQDVFQRSFLNDSETTKANESISFLLKAEHEEQPLEDCVGMYEDFMKLYTNHPHSADVFELIDRYEQTCRNNIKMLRDFINKADPSRKRLKKAINLLNQLYQECYTWRLLRSLVFDRFTAESMIMEDEQPEHVDTSKSEKLLIDHLFKTDATVRQSQIIVDWLEKNMEDKLEDILTTENLRFHSESIYWEHTLHELNGFVLGNRDPALAANIVTEIDPDAPIRQKRLLSVLDQHNEEQLMHCVFRFLRAGKLEEAQKVCCDQGHYWRAATLDGWRLWHDPNYFDEMPSDDVLVAEGNPSRDTWKLTCWSIAEEKTCNVYEKAVYAALSGNLNQLIGACTTWEDMVWAHFKVMVDITVEQEITRYDLEKDNLSQLPQRYWEQMEKNDLTPRGVLAQINGHVKFGIRDQDQDCYRRFQSHLILNEVPELLNEMNRLVTQDKSNTHLLRYMAHMVLFLQATGIQTQEEVCVAVLKKYVEALIDAKQTNLVASYTACLPCELQVEMYARFLQGIDDEQTKSTALELADEAGLELKLITKRIVENIRSENFEDSIRPEDEIRVVSAIDWLVFNPAQRIDAIKQANGIIRKFLGLKKHQSGKNVFLKIPLDSIDIVHKQWRMRAGEKPLPAEDENAIHEYLSIKAYLNAHDAFNAWFEHYNHKLPVKPKGTNVKRTFKEQVALDVANTEYEENLDRWQNTLRIHVKSTSECIYNVLLFPGGWLVDQRQDVKEADLNRRQQLYLLRKLCIPYITFLLHSVLASNKQHRDCFQLAEIIQSKKYSLYKSFEKDDIGKLVSLVRDSAVQLLDEGYEPFGAEKLSVFLMDK